MNTFLRAFLLVVLASAANAADPASEKPMDSSFLKEYAETRGFMLGRPQKPKISPDGKTVLFLRSESRSPRLKLYEFDVESRQTRELLAPETILKGAAEDLSPEEKARRERMRVTAGGFADYHLDPAGKNILVALSGKLYVFDRASGKTTELKTGVGPIVDPKWSPDGKKIAYVRGFDVAVYDLESGQERMVTSGGSLVKTHGLAEFVAQEEMGRFSGFWWSPDSQFIVYEEADHTGVETWYVADPFKPDQKPAEQYYPRPGKKNVAVRLGVVSIDGGETIWMKWPTHENDRYEYLTQVVWDKHGPLTVLLETRKQDRLAVFKVDHLTGETKWIFEIRATDHWVNLKQVALRWASKGYLGITMGNAKLSARTGDSEGLIFNLDGSWCQFDNLIHFDPDSLSTIFTATNASTDMHVFRQFRQPPPPMKFDTRKTTALTRGHGLHSAVSDGNLLCLTRTTPAEMPMTTVVRMDGGAELGELTSVAIVPGFKPNVEFFPNDSRDGSEAFVQDQEHFHAAIVRPRKFDANKKYPVIVDVYGGPGHVHVLAAMRNWLLPQWLADQGFIVVAIDNRGTPGRGDEWEKAIYKKFGTVPIEDQAKWLRVLCDRYPELDRDRVGIVGWSFGGYMAANGVLRRPDVFKAAVAGAPVTDWEDYDTHYTERYMGLLPESQAAYDEASLIPLAKNLSRPLMLVHGTADDNVYYRHTLKLSNALFRAGKDFEAVALPGVTHMYSADPVVMERLWTKTVGFFKKHLGEPK
jgi:dipeptidyl-peptidase-4